MRPPRFPLTIPLFQRYFASGWAFLIPYLAAYLLYYVTGWPVNPAPESPLTPLSPVPLTHPAPLTPLIPSLLHLYWILHALHLTLAAVALRAWWREKSRPSARSALAATSPTRSGLAATPSYSLPATRYSLLTALAPWALLALIFYIPGVYLEWPSDPWEHLRRINEWRILETVGAHSSWYKSSYFIPYSLLSWCIGLRQLFWLDFYYTGICLLLCWQYYKLARACGLGERASMVFVIVQALLFGNNIFSFYRYYGISSSIHAQLGAVALTRIVLEWAAWGKTNLNHRDTKDIEGASIQPVNPSAPPTVHPSPLPLQSRPSFWHLPTLALLAPIALSLLPLIAFNHIQGIGIAGIGITAIIIWRLIEYKRSALWWLIGGTIAINALFLWIYPRPEIIETYRAQGWLNGWYGFNILDLTSPAGDRSLQILGVWGILGIAIAVFLFRRSPAVATLAIAAPLLLLLPAIAVPLSIAIFHAGGELNIVTFQRLLLACPPAIALVVFLDTAKVRSLAGKTPKYPPAIAIGLAMIVVLPPGGIAFNRMWHVLHPPPSDLVLKKELSISSGATRIARREDTDTVHIGSVSALAALNATYAAFISTPFRTIGISPVEALNTFAAFLGAEARPEQPDASPLDVSAINLDRSSRLLIEESAWTANPEAAPQFLFRPPNETENSRFLVQSQPGTSNTVFQRELVRINRAENYQVQATVIGSGSPGAITYLAIAWYDTDGNLLESYRQGTNGAGNPRGWVNGTYSYFGLTGTAAPTTRTTFSIKFGAGRDTVIPPTARYFRVGALLNYTATPGAWVEISDVALRTLSPPSAIAILPPATYAFTAKSQAGQLSVHWPDVQAAIDRGGSPEIRSLLNSSPLKQITVP